MSPTVQAYPDFTQSPEPPPAPKPPHADDCPACGIVLFAGGLFLGWVTLGFAAWAVVSNETGRNESLEKRVRALNAENRGLRASLREPAAVTMPGVDVGRAGVPFDGNDMRIK